MSKEKQIDEMAKEICKSDILCHTCGESTYTYCAEAIAEALYNAGYRKQSEWISVEERLPEENGEYLVYTKYGWLAVERFKLWDDDDTDSGFWWDFEGLVTHWMPLPEAPKMKGGEE